MIREKIEKSREKERKREREKERKREREKERKREWEKERKREEQQIKYIKFIIDNFVDLYVFGLLYL